MKAMVFAAGIGSRLKEHTQKTPKCLVPLGDGTTMLDRVMGSLVRAGVKEVIINLFHLGSSIERHITEKKSYGIRVEFSKEEALLGTGGGLKKAAAFFDESPFFVHNSDIYTDLNLSRLYSAHLQGSNTVTLGIMRRETARPLLFTEDLLLCGWRGADGTEERVGGTEPAITAGFSGVQVVEPKLFSYMDRFEGNFSTIPVFMKAADQGERVAGFDMTGSYWIDMGTPERLSELKRHLKIIS